MDANPNSDPNLNRIELHQEVLDALSPGSAKKYFRALQRNALDPLLHFRHSLQALELWTGFSVDFLMTYVEGDSPAVRVEHIESLVHVLRSRLSRHAQLIEHRLGRDPALHFEREIDGALCRLMEIGESFRRRGDAPYKSLTAMLSSAGDNEVKMPDGAADWAPAHLQGDHILDIFRSFYKQISESIAHGGTESEMDDRWFVVSFFTAATHGKLTAACLRKAAKDNRIRRTPKGERPVRYLLKAAKLENGCGVCDIYTDHAPELIDAAKRCLNGRESEQKRTSANS